MLPAREKGEHACAETNFSEMERLTEDPRMKSQVIEAYGA